MSWESIIQYTLAIILAVLIGYGINLITKPSYSDLELEKKA
jgi:hypothetical protein